MTADAATFAAENEILLELFFVDGSQAATPSETLDKTDALLERATKILQTTFWEGDAICPVRFGAVSVEALLPGPPPGFSCDSSRYRVDRGIHLTPCEGDGLSEIGTIRARVGVGPSFTSPINQIAHLLTHEVGHGVGLDHHGFAPPLYPTLMYYLNPPVGPWRGFEYETVNREQCQVYLGRASPNGRLMQCVYYDEAEQSPYYPAPKWTACSDSTGYCDGTIGNCIETDLRCFTPAGPTADGTDCSAAGHCRVCMGPQAECLPCGTAVTLPRTTRAYVSVTSPGGVAHSLLSLDPESGEQIGSNPLPGEVPALAFDSDQQIFYAILASPDADDHLLVIDSDLAVADTGSLGLRGIRALTYVPPVNRLFGVLSDTGTLISIDPTTRDVSIEFETGLTAVEGLAPWAYPVFSGTGRLPDDPILTRREFRIDLRTETVGMDDVATDGIWDDLAVDQTRSTSSALVRTPGGVIFLPVDSQGRASLEFPTDPGSHSGLVVVRLASVCGDRLVTSSEQCDDGNAYSGDGCDVTCHTSPMQLGALNDVEGSNGAGDGLPAFRDNCRSMVNASQSDLDEDGIGDPCDNCVSQKNSNQADGDGDGNGDACDACPTSASTADTDSDGIPDACDFCPTSNQSGVNALRPRLQSDFDGDLAGEGCDNCPVESNPRNLSPADCNSDGDTLDLSEKVGQQCDRDGDGLGDACDGCPSDVIGDSDDDGLCGEVDNCPFAYNPDQADQDGDGTGDACDGWLRNRILHSPMETPMASATWTFAGSPAARSSPE